MTNTPRNIAASFRMVEPLRQMRSAVGLAMRGLSWSIRRGLGRLDRRLIETHLQADGANKLHLGAGNHELSGWLNSDLWPRSASSIHLDARQPFPFADNQFDFVFSNHMIEHLSFADGSRMLKECLRVLVPGGILRVSTPDFAFLLDIYARPKDPFISRYIDWQLAWINRGEPATGGGRGAIFVVNNFVRDWGHQFIYDREALHQNLALSGFEDIVDCKLNQSRYQPLCNIDNESRAPEGFLELETMTFEGRKPTYDE